MKKAEVSVATIKKFCKSCGADTVQNPIRKSTPTATQEYRCTQCGEPRRYSAKNWMLKVGGKVVALPKP